MTETKHFCKGAANTGLNIVLVTVVKHHRWSPYPPLMKSTNVYSDSTLNDSSVTLKTETHRQRRQTSSNQSETTSPSIFSAVTHVRRTASTVPAGLTVPELMYFFFLPFFFGFKTLKTKHGKAKMSFSSKCSRTVDSHWWATVNNASSSDQGWNW